MPIADLRECPQSGLFYGGRAGQKEGILIDAMCESHKTLLKKRYEEGILPAWRKWCTA